MRSHGTEHDRQMTTGYGKLALALSLSLLVMYPLTMAFVVRWSDFYINLGNFYMAVMMVAPMGLIMLAVMRSMFPSSRVNAILAVSFVALFIAAFWLDRAQVGLGNEQFLRSMIPHHSRAILVCEEAAITDPEIEKLCGQIISTQKEEITIMKDMLEE